MSSSPVICFGQQPCGFFPRRFLFAKFETARRLQSELGGEIVFFCHDSDHDARETQTILRHRKTDEPATLNFAFENKVQRKWSPLFLKRIPTGWQANTARQLGAYVDPKWVEAFKQTTAANAADFCLEMYRRMGLLEGIRVVRSSDPVVRRSACDVADFFVDVTYAGEVVRARWLDGAPKLHEGGESYLTLPAADFSKEQITPTRDTRLRWMQTVVQCTHYIAGRANKHTCGRRTRLRLPLSIVTPSTDLKKPTIEAAPLLAFGAHPDDIEFGCGGVIARETQNGRPVGFVVCSRGEAASNGTPKQRTDEAKKGAKLLGATLDFLELGGDAHFEPRVAHVLKLAQVIRRLKPGIVLAPTPSENQHPDHAVLGKMVRDAARLARYGGVKELRRWPPHAIGALFFYAITVEGEPSGERPVLVDVSSPSVLEAWTRSMLAHSTQARTRHYCGLQLTRASVHGAKCGVPAAMALFPSDPIVVESLAPLERAARRF